MPEWKETVNLPRTDFPMKANLPTTEPETLARWAAMDLYGKIRAPRRGAEIRPARRPAVRQRQHPHGHGAQQDPEGVRRQIAVDGRLRRALRGRLRLPRAADRAEGGSRARPEEARHVGGRFLPGLPCVRRAVRRHDERAVSAARHPRHLGRPVPDDELQVPGGHRARLRPVRRTGARLQRARSRSTGASTAARRSPKRRSSTRITPRRRSTSSFRSRRKAPTSSPRACRRSPADRSRCSSGRRRRGRFRRTWRSRFIPSSITRRTWSTKSTGMTAAR